MLIERTKNEVIIRLPANVGTEGLQQLVDYLAYREIGAKSKATQPQVDKLARQVKRGVVVKESESTRQVRIVVDTNIVFSAILNTRTKIGHLIFNSQGIFDFYSCDHMQIEMERHWDKLLRASGFTASDLESMQTAVFSRIQFIDEEAISKRTWLAAEKMALTIDIDDIDFIALTKHLRAHLWTGDRRLHAGLRRMHFKRVLNTSELFALRAERAIG